MKVQSNIVAPEAGKVNQILVEASELIEKDTSLIRMDTSNSKESKPKLKTSTSPHTQECYL